MMGWPYCCSLSSDCQMLLFRYAFELNSYINKGLGREARSEGKHRKLSNPKLTESFVSTGGNLTTQWPSSCLNIDLNITIG